TAQSLATTEIHANHLEAFHTSLRRRCAAYRRRTNMSAKNTGRLQERLARIIHQPQKPTEEGALESRMMLKTAVSQERHNPKTNASGCPGTVPIGLMVVIGHNASSQPPQAYSTLLAPAPSMDALDRASQGLLG